VVLKKKPTPNDLAWIEAIADRGLNIVLFWPSKGAYKHPGDAKFE
jgi:hypothetical protein